MAEPRFKPLRDLLAEKTIILQGADAYSARGFTQVPNWILRHPRLSPGAKLACAVILSYAWQNNFCFPGQEKMAKDMGSGKRSVVRFIAELEREKALTIKRRGQGKTNIYILHLREKTRHRKVH
jgi:Helix-turn-helix domain